MNALAIGAALPPSGRRKRPSDPHHPTDPVRKHSYDVHDPRAQPWRRIGVGTMPFGKAFTEALVTTLDWLEDKQRDDGYGGPHRVQFSYRRILRALLAKLDYASGRLDPCWATIAAESRRGHTTVGQALETLHELGFVSSVRRTVKIEGAEGQRGPQRRQISCAFFFDCQSRMAPDVFAYFWGQLRAQLSAHGKWLLNKARSVFNTFNTKAVPSPREPKVAAAIARAKQREKPASARPTPAPPPPARAALPTEIAAPRPTAPARDSGLAAALARLGRKLGIDPADPSNASP